MKLRILLGMLFSLAVMTVFGCGGGGGSPAAPGATTVTGTAFKGPFASGSVVKVFAVDPVTRGKGNQLGTGATDALGAYTVDIGSYTGPIIVEVTGSYKDEATGGTVALDPNKPLRAVISNAVGSTSVMVTPLTELATKEMGTVLSNTVIDTKNADIATLFKVGNIITTKPVDATDAASAGAPAAQKDLGLVLAAISQMVKNTPGKTLGDILDQMSTDISGTTMADKSTVGLKASLFDFISSTNNKTGVTTPPASINPTTVKVAVLKISSAGGTIGGIDLTATLPTGVTVATNTGTTQAADGAVAITGAAAAAGTSLTVATFSASKLRVVLANSAGFGAGQFVTVACTLPANSTVTETQLQQAITAATMTATDLTGTPIAGITLSATASVF